MFLIPPGPHPHHRSTAVQMVFLQISYVSLVPHPHHRSTAVRTVFLLIRAKRGASPASRLDSLLSSQLFDTVKSQVFFCLFTFYNFHWNCKLFYED